MKSVIQKIHILAVLTTVLSGCIEVKNGEEEPTVPAMVEVQSEGRRVIDEPMYLYEGRFLTKTELDYELYKNPAGKKNATRDYEFSFTDLEITENGVLYTLGNNVRLHVQNLKTNNGTIVTFPEGATAVQGQNGRHGGHIFLHAQTAQGNLKVQLRGENGGRGVNGKAPDASLKGVNGAPGICTMMNSVLVPVPGKPGGKGLKGYPGGSGGRGGDSGSLEIMITNGEGFSHQVEKIPGLGGKGGSGGAGGEGGDNGEPQCLKGLPKQRGPQGDSGDNGADGKDGEKLNVCLHRGASVSCY